MRVCVADFAALSTPGHAAPLRSSLGAALLLVTLLASSSAHAAEPTWEQVSDDDEITVWQREVPGTSLVEFRGRGPVRASIKNLIAVLRDQDRKTEWMGNCVANHAVQYVSDKRMILYNRVGSPAPLVDDRDVVLESEASFDLATRTVELRFRETTHPKMPPVEGVVRMPKTRGFWRLEYRGPELTEVTYQVQADPGGSLPQWLVNWASKGLPHQTIMGLRRQATRGGYEQQLAYLEAAYDWESLEAQARALATHTSTRAK